MDKGDGLVGVLAREFLLFAQRGWPSPELGETRFISPCSLDALQGHTYLNRMVLASACLVVHGSAQVAAKEKRHGKAGHDAWIGAGRGRRTGVTSPQYPNRRLLRH